MSDDMCLISLLESLIGMIQENLDVKGLVSHADNGADYQS
jgi:hypothetical protein